MYLPVIPRYRKRRRPRKHQPTPTPPAALTLVAAEYLSGDDQYLTLTFDRDVYIGDIDGTQIVVNDDDETGNQFDATGGAEKIGEGLVKLTLVRIGSASGSGVRVSASASSGIVAVDDGGTWAGATDLGLPFP